MLSTKTKLFTITGFITDDVELRKVEFNDEELEIKISNKLQINEYIELKEGENIVVIEAWDISGNTSKKEIKIIYKVPGKK